MQTKTALTMKPLAVIGLSTLAALMLSGCGTMKCGKCGGMRKEGKCPCMERKMMDDKMMSGDKMMPAK